MIYLTGSHGRHVITLGRDDLGLMMQPGGGRCPRQALGSVWWAADNALYRDPDASHRRYLRFLLDRAAYADRCLFATAPDVLGDAAATWRRSEAVLPEIRLLGFRAALVAQDGIEALPIAWDRFDCLFIGGSTEWKLSEAAYAIAAEARFRGKWVHLGRVNSFRRLRAATAGLYDSCDGTYVAFAPDRNLPRLCRWLDAVNAQPPLGAVS